MSIRRHTIYNIVGGIFPLTITIITLPIYMQLIGEERFAVLAIAWVILGYFGLFDLGLGRATAQRIATLKFAEPMERAETFWTALLINLGFGCLGGLLLWPAAHLFFSDYFKVSEQLRPEIISAIPWLVVSLPVATLSGVLSGALQGREKFLALNSVNVFGSFLFQVLPLVVAWKCGPELTLLLPAVILSRMITFCLLFLCCRRYVPLVGAPAFVRSLIKPLFSFGGWVTVTSVVGPVMVLFDRFVIGALSGAKMVAYYTVPYSLAERVTVLPNSLASAIFPRLAAVSPEEQEHLTNESVKVLAVVITPAILIGLFILQPFLSWWMGVEFAEKTSFVGHIFLLGFWVNSFARIPAARLQAKGRPDLVAKCHLVELVPYMATMYLLIVELGIVGAAIAWSLRVTVDCALLFFLSDVSAQTWRLLIAPFLILMAAMISIVTMSSGGLFFTVCVLILTLGLYWSFSNIPRSLNMSISAMRKYFFS